ncbi:FG-GAP repeat protein [Streptomyces sp. NPDC090075]|uniref:FG-GAP and VCBS repeat-containing protein n=1 Tax=Streptomyces sp. NPDC090075 TaxID=3365937 RepID=UPI00380F8690
MRSRRPFTASGTGRTAGTVAATLLLTIGATITVAAPSAAVPPAPITHDDFDNDGYRDLVVSAPGGTVSGKKGAGYVAVLYGSASGLSTTRRATFSLSTPGIEGLAATGDGFGQATATADIDRDGFDDLIVGAPGKDIGAAVDAGSATVLFGSAGGLRATGSRRLGEITPVAGNRFGTGLAAGWFKVDDSSVAILSKDSLWAFSFEVTSRGRRMVTDHNPLSRFVPADFRPTALTMGDYNKDRADDLVVLGSGTYDTAGVYGRAVYVSGSRGGWADHYELSGGGPVGASGDVDKDGYADVVVGSPDERDSQGHPSGAGVVYVHFGGPSGPGSATGGRNRQFWTQNSPGVPGVNRSGDRFGAAVTVRDVDGDGYDEVAIGAPGNDVGAAADAGTVWVLRGSATGLTTQGVRVVSQSPRAVPGVPEQGDRFGGAVRLIDADRDKRAGLVVGAPGENGGDGGVWVLPATSGGLSFNRSWSFDGGTLHAPVPGARFGETLAPHGR